MATGSFRTASRSAGTGSDRIEHIGGRALSGSFRSVVRVHEKADQRRLDCAYKRVELERAEDLEIECARRYGRLTRGPRNA